MHDKYWLLGLAALMVLALYLQWWPRGQPGGTRAFSRACWVVLYLVILSGAVQLVAYDPDAVMGSPKAWVQAGSFFVFWGALALAGVFGVLATYRRFFHRPAR